MADSNVIMLFPTPESQVRRQHEQMVIDLGLQAAKVVNSLLKERIPSVYEDLSRDEQMVIMSTYAAQLLRDAADRLEIRVILPRLEKEKEQLEKVAQ